MILTQRRCEIRTSEVFQDNLGEQRIAKCTFRKKHTSVSFVFELNEFVIALLRLIFGRDFPKELSLRMKLTRLSQRHGRPGAASFPIHMTDTNDVAQRQFAKLWIFGERGAKITRIDDH